MRRLFLIVMMFVLPLQFSWAAIAAVSAHAIQADAEGHGVHHNGHHEHAHDHDHDGASSRVVASDAVDTDTGADAHDDGSTCHSHGHSHGSDFVSAAGALHLPAAAHGFADHRLRHVPEAVLDELLRPPLADLA